MGLLYAAAWRGFVVSKTVSRLRASGMYVAHWRLFLIVRGGGKESAFEGLIIPPTLCMFDRTVGQAWPPSVGSEGLH